ncbi:GNAT family N-acetyltransferase [[Clostridium] polysaccharolyticum]|uniref:L-amino acid N-acyltransferase YncA n=1 Tax=[Clostridium] polysaccharolyticum TaxID=29364 RepID=A0A1I0DQZ7_9FIRM|nr:GNAT family N-acetyltransferase [[Clostridium] polysaccharolyticum]SET34683.1 L-amino acid N-acyltransferase YncA [[Clostridium] polysaccharolyticum]
MEIRKNEVECLENVQKFVEKSMQGVEKVYQTQCQMFYGNLQMIQQRVSHGMEKMYTVWEGDSCIALLSAVVSPNQGTGCISATVVFTYVDEKHRNQKIASQLVDTCLNDCRESGINKLTLSVAFPEKRTLCLYITKGFKPEGYVNSIKEEYDTVILGKLL